MCAKCAERARGSYGAEPDSGSPGVLRFPCRGTGTYEPAGQAYGGPGRAAGEYAAGGRVAGGFAPAGDAPEGRAPDAYGHPAFTARESAAVSGGRHSRPRRTRQGGGGGGTRRVPGGLPGPMLRLRAERHPTLVPGLPFGEPPGGRPGGLPAGGAGTAGISFAELDRRARSVAARLGAALSPGSKVLLAYPEGPDLAGAFFGCLYAGMAAIPLVLPAPGATGAVSRAVAACDPALVLTGTDGWHALSVDRTRTQVVEADGVRVAGEPVWRLAQQWRPVGVLRGAAAYHRYHDDGAAGGRLEAAMDHGDLAEVLGELAQAVRLGTDEENIGWIAAVHGLEEAVWRILLPVRVTS
ncbi:AMP-binding protein [Streptomyces sp. NPDC020983]|uniref:AMP-binding protein n=1 Tax=Streptomyces sp. NPDC020983 TaxID=3365106 RepID=UPI00379528A7